MDERTRQQAVEEAVLREKRKKRKQMIQFAVRMAVSIALLAIAIVLVKKYCA